MSEEKESSVKIEEVPSEEPKITTVEEPDKNEDSDDVPELEKQEGEKEGQKEKKMNKGERKCRAALQKVGMKVLGGITRVTLKKKNDAIFAINNPEVYKSSANENCFVIFGEMKLENQNSNMAKTAADKFTSKTEPIKEEDETVKEEEEGTKKEEEPEKKVEEVPEEDTEPLDETGLDPMNIDMTIQHCKCTRNQAIRALRESDGDMVSAIMKLTK